MVLFAFLLSDLACEPSSPLSWVRATHATPVDTQASRVRARLAANVIEKFPALNRIFLIADPTEYKDSIPPPARVMRVGRDYENPGYRESCRLEIYERWRPGQFCVSFGRKEPIIIRSTDSIKELSEAAELSQRAVYAEMSFLRVLA